MRILAFDQSSKLSGWCVSEDGVYIDSGVIDKHKITNSDKRIAEMGLEIYKKIAEVKPDLVIVENIQNQSNTATVILLARLQGMILGYCAAHKIRAEILGPSQWRSVLQYRQGPKVKREELKQQSIDFVKEKFGFENFSEDRCEAIAINVAAQELFDDTWGE
jgi:Holliday junction resolvasome RuvABC endonuclease subunit